MDRMKDAIDRIKGLECPAGDVENRVAEILDMYGVAGKDKIFVARDNSQDGETTEVYTVKFADESPSITVLARTGLDDYVAKVVNVRLEK